MSALDTAVSAWGEDIPEWIVELARECDRTSQNRTARLLKRSAALVSNLLRNKYPADLSAVEDIIRGVLMSENLTCPAMGSIGKQVCREWRGRAENFENVNSNYVRMYRACNRCPRHVGPGQTD